MKEQYLFFAFFWWKDLINLYLSIEVQLFILPFISQGIREKIPFELKLRPTLQIWSLATNDQIWRVGLHFNWNGIHSLSPSEMKGNINNCTLIDMYKLTKPFHTNKCKKQILVFQRLLWKHTCMWWRGLSQLNPCNSLHVWV